MNKVYSNKRASLEMRDARLVYSDEKFQFFFKSTLSLNWERKKSLY